MIKKAIILILFFYLLALLQTSFLVHFRIFGFIPNLILIFVIFYSLLESPKKHSGILAGFVGGFFMDIFSSGFIGFYVLILLAVSIFIKLVLRKYVWSPIS